MPDNIEKNYPLRDLEADDIFIMVNIINKIGIKEFKTLLVSDEIRGAVNDVRENKGANEEVFVSVALDVASILLSNIVKCKGDIYDIGKQDIYDLLAALTGLNAADVAKLPLKTFAGMIFELVKKREFADFFQGAAKFLK